MQSIIGFGAFLLITLGGGIAIGLACPPGDWYERLRKPSFNPPKWVFAPAWTILYILIAIAGWRTWQDGSAGARALWALQLVLNFAWSPVFFRAHAPRAALGIIAGLFIAAVAFMVLQADRDPVAAALFAPYGLWIAFAGVLNAAIVRLNGDIASTGQAAS
jgi:tryptophan-rich sensory protein